MLLQVKYLYLVSHDVDENRKLRQSSVLSFQPSVLSFEEARRAQRQLKTEDFLKNEATVQKQEAAGRRQWGRLTAARPSQWRQTLRRAG